MTEKQELILKEDSKKEVAHRDRFKFDFKALFLEMSTSQKSLRRICQDMGYTYHTVYRQIERDIKLQEAQDFAREHQADHIVMSMLDRIDEMYEKINDVDYPFKHKNSLVAAVRVEFENLRWIASKFRPKLYGEKQEVTHDFSKIKAKLNEMFPVKNIE